MPKAASQGPRGARRFKAHFADGEMEAQRDDTKSPDHRLCEMGLNLPFCNVHQHLKDSGAFLTLSNGALKGFVQPCGIHFKLQLKLTEDQHPWLPSLCSSSSKEVIVGSDSQPRKTRCSHNRCSLCLPRRTHNS